MTAVRELLEERGYQELRVADVARWAGIGIAALYRRWPDKRSLVIDALRTAASRLDVPQTEDPVEDVVAGLLVLAASFATQSRALLALAVGGQDPELSAVIRESKIAGIHQENRARVRRVLGEGEEADLRADIGPAMILHDVVVHGVPPSEERIRGQIVPLMLGIAATRTNSAR